MMTRRYRFVEDELMIGRAETNRVVELTRNKFKLWNRVEAATAQPVQDSHYASVIAQSRRVRFPGFSDILERRAERRCLDCSSALFRNGTASGQFGGIRLCDGCKDAWRSYMENFLLRMVATFPEITSFVINLGYI